MHKRRILSSCLTATLLITSLAADAGDVDVTDLTINGDVNSTQVLVDLSQAAKHNVFAVSSPERIVVDIEGVRINQAPLDLPAGDGGITQIRSAISPNGTLRLVLSLANAMKFNSSLVKAGGRDGYRLVIDLSRKENEKPARRVILTSSGESLNPASSAGRSDEEVSPALSTSNLFAVLVIVIADVNDGAALTHIVDYLSALADVRLVKNVDAANVVLEASFHRLADQSGYLVDVRESETITGFNPSNWDEDTNMWVSYLRKEGFTQVVRNKEYSGPDLASVSTAVAIGFDQGILSPKRRARTP